MSSEAKNDGVDKPKSSDGEPRKPRRRPGKAGPSPTSIGNSGTPKQAKFDGKCEELLSRPVTSEGAVS